MTTQRVQLPEEDQRVTFHGVSWDHFETMLDIRGDATGVRVTYVGGELELMSPSRGHERVKTVIARLIETYAIELNIPLDGFGSWTLRKAVRAVGVEPDECYILGPQEKDRPDLVVEVIWTAGGLDKLEAYALLGVPEAWIWEKGRITVYLLGPDGYRTSARSGLFPALDLDAFSGFIDRPSQSQSVRDLLSWLRSRGA